MTLKDRTQVLPLMYEHIREQCELAITYAEDGAYASAARVLSDIAKETLMHAMKVSQV